MLQSWSSKVGKCFGMWFTDQDYSSWLTKPLCETPCINVFTVLLCQFGTSEATSDSPIYWHHRLNNTTYENARPRPEAGAGFPELNLALNHCSHYENLSKVYSCFSPLQHLTSFFHTTLHFTLPCPHIITTTAADCRGPWDEGHAIVFSFSLWGLGPGSQH